MRVITPKPQDEHIARRLVTAVVHEWDRLPEHVRAALLREACLAHDPILTHAQTSLEDDIKAFIREHQERT